MIHDYFKNKLANNVCDKNISIDRKGNILFKGKIKHNLNMRKFSEIEALYIVYDLIYDIVNSKLRHFNEIDMYLFNLIKKVNKAHDEKTPLYVIFRHNYDFEKSFVINYLKKQQERHDIENIDLILFNSSLPSLNVKEPIKITPEVKQKKKNKLNLNHLTRDDLCYILNLNPQLTFEKEKILKKRLIQDFSNVSKNQDDLENLSKKEIKELLIPFYKRKLKREKFNDLISKVKKFNNQNFSEILNSQKEYLALYEEINDNFNECENSDIKEFLSYRDIYDISFSEIDSLSDFELPDCYLDYNLRKKIYSKYSFLNTSKINDLPEFLKNKLFKNNPAFKNISLLLKDLQEYSDISNTKKDNLIRVHNETILDREIDKNKHFFKDIDDENKKRAIVLDEKNVRVVAGAGTGKTFTIQKKVKYLIEHKNVLPERILCLCYTNKGAIELDSKVNNEIDNGKVEVCTFHEFCRRIDRDCGYNKSTDRYLLDKIIRNYIKYILDKPEKLNKIMEYFGYYINPPKEEEKINCYDELIEYKTANDLTTLKNKYYGVTSLIDTFNGEIVRSLGELIIANYLFMHDIDYEYEAYYNHHFADLIKRFYCSGNYLSLNQICEKYTNAKIIKEWIEDEKKWQRHRPDFYLPEYDIYLEHFGIGRSNNEKWLNEDYINQMERKRFRHKLYGTKLLETYYYDLAEGVLVDKLEELLNENDVRIGQFNQKDIINIITKSNEINDYKNFKKLIKTFINIFEAQYYPKNMFDVFRKRNMDEKNGYIRNRQDLFLDIVEDIYDLYYEKNLGDIIDHNREITNALELMQNKEYVGHYDYVLIDEYQDINNVRCNLLQELQNITNCKIFVVGDDWQSIYRFNGSDVGLFINFNKYFPHNETIKLEENRRNCQKIIDITSDFILNNTNQEEKSLSYYEPENDFNTDPIKIVQYKKENWFRDTKKNKILLLNAIIQDILKNNTKKDLKILLLGRNRNDLDHYVNNSLFKEIKDGNFSKIKYSKNIDLDITFMTIHQAKGLEYDEVVILRLEDHEYGFPNHVVDDPILSFVKTYEKYPLAEERRIFYVALTRTLNNVYLMVPDSNESIFIEDLRKDYNIKNTNLSIDNSINIYEESDFFKEFSYFETDIDCPNCDEGKVTLVVNNVKGTKYFRCSEHAVPNPSHYSGGPYYGKNEDVKYMQKCPICEGILIRNGDILKCSLNKENGCIETKELKLDKKDLEYRD